jgi:tetratricopeptide (TPR) repeat protein
LKQFFLLLTAFLICLTLGYALWKDTGAPARVPAAAGNTPTSSQPSPKKAAAHHDQTGLTAPDGKPINPIEWKQSPLTIDELQANVDSSQQDYRRMWYLGAKLADAGRFDEAYEVFTQMVSAWPQDAQVRLEISRVCSERGEYEQAISHLRKLVEIAPHHPGMDAFNDFIGKYEERPGSKKEKTE